MCLTRLLQLAKPVREIWKKASSLSCYGHDGMSLLFELAHGVTIYLWTFGNAIQHETYCTTLKMPPYTQSCTSTVNRRNTNWVGGVWILLSKPHARRKVAPAVHIQTHSHVLHCQDLTITANYRETVVLQEIQEKTYGEERERNTEEIRKKKL